MKKLFVLTSTLMVLFGYAIASADTVPVLLIPDNNNTIQMFDPQDGHHLGEFLAFDGTHDGPTSAIQGPDGNIFVNYANTPSILAYDNASNFLSVYADDSDGLDGGNWAIAFRNDSLFVSEIFFAVGIFDGPHSYVGPFITDYALYFTFDTYFLDDGQCLISAREQNIMALVPPGGGSSYTTLFNPGGPNQIHADPQNPGQFIVPANGDDAIYWFDLDGNVPDTMSFGGPWPYDGAYSVYRLGNGNLLVTGSGDAHGNYGVFILDGTTGDVIDTVSTVRSFYSDVCQVDWSLVNPRCEYIVGDANGSGGLNGLDVTYGVAYFKGGPPPSYSCECTSGNTWFVAGDANASCNYNGLDITYLVAYLKGGPAPAPCADCPPAR